MTKEDIEKEIRKREEIMEREYNEFKKRKLQDRKQRIFDNVRLLRSEHRLNDNYPSFPNPATCFQLGNQNKKKVFKVYFHKQNNQSYYIAKYIVEELAYDHYILENEWSDDESVNHVAIFKEDQVEELAFFHFIVHQEKVDDGIWGFSVYNVNLSYLQRNFKHPKFSIPHYCGHITKGDLKKHEMAKSLINKLVNELDWQEEQLIDYFTLKYMLPTQYEYDYTNYFLNMEKQCNWKTSEEFMLRRDKIYSDLVKEGKVPIKWVNEYNLFILISKHFSDAIFQYSPNWLNMLSYDIFIPSLNLAFEYQGIQHYEPIKFFGGELGFERRLLNDQEKKEISQENGIKLIEWKYNEPISEGILKQKLNENGVITN